MKFQAMLGVGMLAAGLMVAGSQAGAQEDTSAGSQQYKQRVDTLEKKVEQLERATRDNAVMSEDQQKAAKDKEKPTDMLAFWKDGLNLASRDGNYTMHIGGRLQYDWGWLGEDVHTREYTIPGASSAIGDQLDGTELRRLRFQMDGTIYSTFYKLEMDIAGSEKAVQKAGGDPAKFKTSTVILKDAYIGVKDLFPCGAVVQVGHFKEPFSLEELTSDNYSTFMERGLPNAFVPSYNAGIQLSNAVLNNRVTWAAGVFRDTDDRGYSQSEGGYNVTGRVTGLPWYSNNGEDMAHLGAAISFRCPQTSVDYSARPEMHLASTYVDTGTLNTDKALLLGGEAAIVRGPLSLQGEYIQANVNRMDAGNVSFNGGYVQASYFVTGEHRPYKQSAGIFDRVHPAVNVGQTKDGVKGCGAWELAARYSYLDLNDKDVRGGKISDASAGVNWYLNPNMRVMADYTRAMLADNGAQKGGSTDEFGLRFQVDF